MLVSPATVTRVNGAVLDEHEAAKTSSNIVPIANKTLFGVANLDVKTFIMMFSFWGSKLKCLLAERLDSGNPALFRVDAAIKELQKGKRRPAVGAVGRFLKEFSKDEAWQLRQQACR